MATPEAAKPKHRQLFEEIGLAIEKGAFVPGQRLPTEAELMQQYGVSRTTVTRTLRDLEHRGVIWRRRGIGHVRQGGRAHRDRAVRDDGPRHRAGQHLPQRLRNPRPRRRSRRRARPALPPQRPIEPRRRSRRIRRADDRPRRARRVLPAAQHFRRRRPDQPPRHRTLHPRQRPGRPARPRHLQFPAAQRASIWSAWTTSAAGTCSGST